MTAEFTWVNWCGTILHQNSPYNISYSVGSFIDWYH